PLAFVRKAVIGSFMFWYVVTTKKNSLLVGGLALAAWILAFIGMWRGRGRYPFWLLLVPVLSLQLIYALGPALGRYPAPSIPPWMVLAAFGVDSQLRAIGGNKRLRGSLDLAPE